MTTPSSEPVVAQTEDFKLVIRETADSDVPPEFKRIYMLVDKVHGVVAGRGNVLPDMLFSMQELQSRMTAYRRDPTARPMSHAEQAAFIAQLRAGGNA